MDFGWWRALGRPGGARLGETYSTCDGYGECTGHLPVDVDLLEVYSTADVTDGLERCDGLEPSQRSRETGTLLVQDCYRTLLQDTASTGLLQDTASTLHC